jgi:hypothetical protein
MLRSTRPPKCKFCKERTDKVGMALHLHCVDGWWAKEREKKARAMDKKLAEARRNEKRRDRAKRNDLKTIPDLIKEAQREFNQFIRLRDRGQPCICCGQPLGAGEVGGAYDCGHYRSTGSASHLRFDERNAHAQRKHCNRYGAGRAVDYRVGLIGRIGLGSVEALEADNQPRKWTREELIAIRDTYRAKVRALKKETA